MTNSYHALKIALAVLGVAAMAFVATRSETLKVRLTRLSYELETALAVWRKQMCLLRIAMLHAEFSVFPSSRLFLADLTETILSLDLDYYLSLGSSLTTHVPSLLDLPTLSNQQYFQ